MRGAMSENTRRDDTAEASGASKSRRRRQWLFALLPALALLLTAECGTRLLLVTSPGLQSVPLPPESAGLIRDDPELFWSLRPNLDLEYLGARVTTNSLGLRGSEVGRATPAEYRILSLGESTTFGSGVENEQTYTALLARELDPLLPGREVTSINGGVPAYSSFQSLRYFEERGLELDPDMLILYHELNDYLPSSLRDSSNNEVGLLQTDWQRWDSERGAGLAFVARNSALIKFLRSHLARERIESFDAAEFDNPLLEIGLPDIGISPRLARGQDGEPSVKNEAALGRRVSDEERYLILQRFAQLADERGIELLLIHPAYQASNPHPCVLTRFARDAGVMMSKAGVALHPPELPRGSLFRDPWHPNAEGHARLAKRLAKDITDFFPLLVTGAR